MPVSRQQNAVLHGVSRFTPFFVLALTGVVGVESELTVDAVASLTEAAGFSDGVAVVVEVDVKAAVFVPST